MKDQKKKKKKRERERERAREQQMEDKTLQIANIQKDEEFETL